MVKAPIIGAFLSFNSKESSANFGAMNGNFHTISAILRGMWAIDREYAESQLPLVMSMLRGNAIDSHALVPVAGDMTDDRRMLEERYAYNKTSQIMVAVPQGASAFEPRWYDGFRDAPKGSVGIIPISGPVMRNDYCGDAGTMTNARRMKEAMDSPNIDAVVLRINSPGGEVYGTDTLGKTIAEAKKPVVAVIEDGMAASAAYWIASQANEIYATNDISKIGSIGVYVSFYDFSEYLKKEGIKLHEIYAPQSTEKNQDYLEARDGKYDRVKKNMAVLADAFINTVKAGRGAKLQDDGHVFKGATYYAAEAAEIGLIDGILGMDEAISRAASLAKTNTKGLYV